MEDIHPEMKKFHDPKLTALAELLGVEHVAAIGLRSMLVEMSVDLLKSPDLTSVPTPQWALVFSLPIEAVPEFIECFVGAGLLQRKDGRLLLADWDAHVADECGTSCRSAIRDHIAGFDAFEETFES